MCNEVQEKQSEAIDLTKDDEDEEVDSAKSTCEDLPTYCCSFRIVVRNEVSCLRIVYNEKILLKTIEFSDSCQTDG